MLCSSQYGTSSHQHKNPQGNRPTNQKPHEEWKNGILYITTNIGCDGNSDHSRYESGDGSAYPSNMAYRLHGNGPKVTEQKAQGKKLHGQEGNQYPQTRILGIPEQAHINHGNSTKTKGKLSARPYCTSNTSWAELK